MVGVAIYYGRELCSVGNGNGDAAALLFSSFSALVLPRERQQKRGGEPTHAHTRPTTTKLTRSGQRAVKTRIGCFWPTVFSGFGNICQRHIYMGQVLSGLKPRQQYYGGRVGTTHRRRP